MSILSVVENGINKCGKNECTQCLLKFCPKTIKLQHSSNRYCLHFTDFRKHQTPTFVDQFPFTDQFQSTKMHYATLIGLCLFAFMLKLSVSLPDGAPASACQSLMPGHNVAQQFSSAPFSVNPMNLVIEQGKVLQLNISSQFADKPIGGFIIQARNVNATDKIIGRFLPSADGLYRLMNCTGGLGNSATHVSPAPKDSITLLWKAPRHFVGSVFFK